MRDIHVCIRVKRRSSVEVAHAGSIPVDEEGAELLTSLGVIISEDMSEHFNWLLPQYEALYFNELSLRQGDVEVKAVCKWVNHRGGGGPEITPNIMRELIKLRLGCEIFVS